MFFVSPQAGLNRSTRNCSSSFLVTKTLLGRFHQLVWFLAKRLGECIDGFERGGLEPSFQLANVRAMEARPIRQILLRDADLFTQFAQHSTEGGVQGF